MISFATLMVMIGLTILRVGVPLVLLLVVTKGVQRLAGKATA
jgi:hypothetical protein